MPKAKNPIVTTVYNLLEPVLENHKMELYDVEFITEHGRQVLRIYIDKEGGVTLDDCEEITHAVNPVLDTHDPIPDAYVLEVSSPGVERKLVKDRHFTNHIGRQVDIRLDKPFNAQKKFRGLLAGIEDDYVLLDDLKLPRENMIYCRLVYMEMEE